MLDVISMIFAWVIGLALTLYLPLVIGGMLTKDLLGGLLGLGVGIALSAVYIGYSVSLIWPG